MHENGQIDHNCAINCEILGNKNAGNKYTTKSKNLSDIEIILKSIHWFARYRIFALISIGQLCKLIILVECLLSSLMLGKNTYSESLVHDMAI